MANKANFITIPDGWKDFEGLSRLALLNTPYYQSTVDGATTNVDEKVPGLWPITKGGTVASIASAAHVSIFPTSTGLLVALGAAQKLHINSSHADDTAAGDGVRKVRIIGLDTNGALQTEEITMNGVTLVQSANDYLPGTCEMYATEWGATNLPAGNITLSDQIATGAPISVMAAGENNAQNAVFHVPTGHAFQMNKVIAEGEQDGLVRVYRNYTDTFAYIEPVATFPLGSHDVNLSFAANDLIHLTIENTSGSAGQYTASFSGHLISLT